MNPDLNDPQWQAQREALWKVLADDLSSELSRKKLKQYRQMFFEAEFDYGNEAKYGEFKFHAEVASSLCPVQTVERWGKYLTQDLPRWKRDAFEPIRTLRNFAALDHSRRQFGWDLQTELELVRYILGDRYQPQGYRFEGNSMPYPVSANYVHYAWMSNISKWVSGILPDEDVKWVYLFDYWVSALPDIDSIFFNLKRSRNNSVSSTQYSLQAMLLEMRDFDIEKIKQTKLEEEDPVIVQDSGKRAAFVGVFKQWLGGADVPERLRQLWAMVQKADFQMPEWHDWLDADEDNGDQVARSFEEAAPCVTS